MLWQSRVRDPPMRSWLLLLLVLVAALVAWWPDLAPPKPGSDSAAATQATIPTPAAAPGNAAAAEPRASSPTPPLAPSERIDASGTLRVRAIDHRGQPVAGTTVWFAVDHRQTDGRITESMQALPPTGADGTTTLVGAVTQLAPAPIVGARLFVRVVGADGPVVPIAPRELPNDVVDVQVPASGRVRVELRHGDGTAWTLDNRNERFHLAALDAEGRRAGPEFLLAPARGAVEFPQVALARRFRVWTASEWAPPVEFQGPVLADTLIVVPLVVKRRLRVVHGRLLGPDGSPWRRPARFTAEADSRRSAGDFAPDADGRFVQEIAWFVGDQPRLHATATSANGRLEVMVKPNGPLRAGHHDLGDLVLGEPPLLVAGQLQWDPRAVAGDSFAGIQVWFEWGPGGDGPWLGEHTWPVAADGSFVLRSHAMDGPLRLCFGGACAPRPPVPFVPGTSDLRVAVAPPSRLQATFLVDAGEAGDTWRVELRPHAGTPRQPQMPGRGPPGPGERFTIPGQGAQQRDGNRLTVVFENLAAGSYALRVQRDQGPLVVDLHVEVPWSTTAADPRLHDLDLRGR